MWYNNRHVGGPQMAARRATSRLTEAAVARAVERLGAPSWNELTAVLGDADPALLKRLVDALVQKGKLVEEGAAEPPSRYKAPPPPPPLPKFQKPRRPSAARSRAKPLVDTLEEALRKEALACDEGASDADSALASLAAQRPAFEQAARHARLAARAQKGLAAIDAEVAFWSEQRSRAAERKRIAGELLRRVREVLHAAPPAPVVESLVDRLRSIYHRIDREGRFLGYVPVPRLWEAVREELGVVADRKAFDKLLLDLASSRVLELVPLNDASSVPAADLAQALRNPRDGSLRYFVTWSDER